MLLEYYIIISTDCDLRMYSKETKTMDYFLVGFFSLWDFDLLGYFPTWDFFLMGFCPLDFVLMGFFPLGFFPHEIFSYMGFCPHGIPRTQACMTDMPVQGCLSGMPHNV